MTVVASDALYIGISGNVVAVDRTTGAEVWRSHLKSNSSFTSVLWEDGLLYAATGGELYRLDPATGAVLWHNRLKGLGTGLVSFGTAGAQVAPAAERRRREQAAAAAGAAAASG